jgi:hypothetical protein
MNHDGDRGVSEALGEPEAGPATELLAKIHGGAIPDPRRSPPTTAANPSGDTQGTSLLI